MKIVLIGTDRIWLARMREALSKAGHRVEFGNDLSDTGVLVRATSPELLMFDVGAGDDLAKRLQVLGPVMEAHPDLDVMLILAAMPPSDEQQIIDATRSAGIELHFPRRFVIGPYFDAVLRLIGERRTLRQAVEEPQEEEPAEPPSEPAQLQQDAPVADFSVLRDALNQELRRGTELSLMVIGIDNLEEIQEKRGHEVAQEALQDLAELVQADLREMDIVARTESNDRLAVLLPVTQAAEAEQVASRIQNAMARQSLGAMSITAGIAEAEEGMDADTLISHVESAWNEAPRRDDRLAVAPGAPNDPAQ